MNLPPTEYTRVSPELMSAFVTELGLAAGLPAEKAALLAELLTANDLRGVFSHGTEQIATYARLLREGTLNNDPQVQVVRESPVSVMVDGDGGLGYFPAYAMTERVIEKAKTQGMAVGLTRNHGHFGAAGIYARLTLPHDLLCFVTSGHQLLLKPGQPINVAAGGSPMSFSAPGNEETSILVDFGAMHDLYLGSPHREEIARLAPGLVFRSIGMGSICQAWGGFLAGVPLDTERAERTFSGANQGSLVMAFRIDLFADPAQFKHEVDEYVRAVRRLAPLEGFKESFVAGGVEAANEVAFRREGIPCGPTAPGTVGDCGGRVWRNAAVGKWVRG